MPSCSVFNCKPTRIKVSYFRFPKNEEMALKWVSFCKRESINVKNARVCSRHFKRECYAKVPEHLRIGGFTLKRKLLDTAIPTEMGEFKTGKNKGEQKSLLVSKNTQIQNGASLVMTDEISIKKENDVSSNSDWEQNKPFLLVPTNTQNESSLVINHEISIKDEYDWPSSSDCEWTLEHIPEDIYDNSFVDVKPLLFHNYCKRSYDECTTEQNITNTDPRYDSSYNKESLPHDERDEGDRTAIIARLHNDNRELREENGRLKAALKRNEKKKHKEARQVACEILSPYFTSGQIRRMLNPEKKCVKWSTEDIKHALALQNVTPKGYNF